MCVLFDYSQARSIDASVPLPQQARESTLEGVAAVLLPTTRGVHGGDADLGVRAVFATPVLAAEKIQIIR